MAQKTIRNIIAKNATIDAVKNTTGKNIWIPINTRAPSWKSKMAKNGKKVAINLSVKIVTDYMLQTQDYGNTNSSVNQTRNLMEKWTIKLKKPTS